MSFSGPRLAREVANTRHASDWCVRQARLSLHERQFSPVHVSKCSTYSLNPQKLRRLALGNLLEIGHHFDHCSCVHVAARMSAQISQPFDATLAPLPTSVTSFSSPTISVELLEKRYYEGVQSKERSGIHRDYIEPRAVYGTDVEEARHWWTSGSAIVQERVKGLRQSTRHGNAFVLLEHRTIHARGTPRPRLALRRHDLSTPQSNVSPSFPQRPRLISKQRHTILQRLDTFRASLSLPTRASAHIPHHSPRRHHVLALRYRKSQHTQHQHTNPLLRLRPRPAFLAPHVADRYPNAGSSDPRPPFAKEQQCTQQIRRPELVSRCAREEGVPEAEAASLVVRGCHRTWDWHGSGPLRSVSCSETRWHVASRDWQH